MKKSFYSLIFLGISCFGVMNAMENKAEQLASPKVPLEKKVKIFDTLVKYIDQSRDCLSGIGCSKRTSYTANFVLGATIGFAEGFLAGQLKEGKYVPSELMQQTALLRAIVETLGYQYFVKKRVNLFQCLTFRGCDDQTKRYLMYEVGLTGGAFSGIFARIGFDFTRVELLKRDAILIRDEKIKNALALSPQKELFLWYEILGFHKSPSRVQARQKFRTLAREHHPDKVKNKEDIEAINTANNIMKILNEAAEKGGVL